MNENSANLKVSVELRGKLWDNAPPTMKVSKYQKLEGIFLSPANLTLLSTYFCV